MCRRVYRGVPRSVSGVVRYRVWVEGGQRTVFPALSRPRKRSLAPAKEGVVGQVEQVGGGGGRVMAYSCLPDLERTWKIAHSRSKISQLSSCFRYPFLGPPPWSELLLTERGQHVPEPVLYPVHIPFRQLFIVRLWYELGFRAIPFRVFSTHDDEHFVFVSGS